MTNSYTTGPNLFRKFLFASFTLALSVLFSVSSWGQLGANYAFNASAGTYSSISATGTAVGAAILADDASVNITGLTPGFTVNGVTYTNARMNSNGWLALYATTAPTTSTSYASLSTAMTNGAVIICPFNGDQNGAGGTAWRQTIGNEHIFEWANFVRFGATGESLNYQVRLNTSTGAISFVYGTMTAGTGTGTPQIGFKTTGTTAANWATDVNNLTINVTGSPNTCTWANAVTGPANNSTMYLNTANPLVKPASGQTFTWTPQASPAPVRTFAAPATISSSGATVSWTAPTGATSYELQYRAVGQCAWTNFSGNPLATATATLTGLADGTAHQIRVRASNGSAFSIWSHIPSATAGAGTNGYIAAGSFTTLALPPTVTNFTPNQPLCSSGGQTVVITGTSFVAGAVPRFNGTNATGVVINSTTQITCVTPVGITAGNITVQTSAGISATGAANAYTLSANPVVEFAPNDTVAPCGSFATPVTASNTATGLVTTYAWSNNSTLSAATGASVNVATTTNQNYVVTATDSRGCTGTRTLYAIPTVPDAVTVGTSVPYFCGTGGLVNITASSVNPNYTYTFSVVAGGTISNVAASTCDYTVSSTSAMKTRAEDAGTGCATDVFTSIGVYPFPTPTMSATPDTICEGSTSDLGSGLSAGNFSVASIPWVANTAPGTATALMNNGTASVALSGGSLDDGGWAGVPLGFSFNYFGTSFTTVACGTNGLVMFGAVPGYGTSTGQLGQFTFSGSAASCTPAGPATGRFFPNCNNPGNVIALMAADGNAGTSTAGNLKYWTSGFAPNRIFNLKYDTYRFFGSTSTFTATLRLYETTGIVEIFIDEKQLSNNAIVGLQDATKLIGAVAPNRPTNPVTNAVAAWTVTSGSGEAWRFSPPSNYTTAWTPSGSINGTASGTNLFTRTTNALNTVGTNTINLVVTDQTTGCSNSAAPATVNVEVLAIPSVPASADVTGYGSILGSGSAAQSPLTICGAQTVTVNYGGALGSGEIVRWYDAATSGTLLGTGLSYTTPSLTNSDSVYVEIYNGVCSSPSRRLFDINYNIPPAITITSNGPDNDVNCGVGPTYEMGYTASSANAGYAYTWVTDSIAATFSPSGANVTLTSTATTNSTVTAFDATTGCSISEVKGFSIYEFPNIVPTSADSIICVGDSTIVSSGVAAGAFSANCTTFGLRTAPGSAVSLCAAGAELVPQTPNTLGFDAPLDDSGWEGIPIGFSFDYFGTVFSTLNVGTNGVANFGPYGSFDSGQYLFAAGFPSASSPVNTIAVIATDMRMDVTGTVRYWTEGVAPNRVFVLEYLDCPGWSNGVHTAQLHLFETLGRVEIHVYEATSTGGLGNKTIGLQNGDGTVGTTAPVCNIAPVGSELWNNRAGVINTAFPWAWRFNPPVDYTFTWSPSGEISGATNEADIVAYPTATAAATQNYSIQVTDNISGCVGTPVSYPVQIIEAPALPNIVGYGLFSEQDGTNGTTFCGPQGVEWYCSDALAPGWQVVYYTQAVGGTGFPFEATDTLTFTAGAAVAELSANDTIWASLNNGSCDGPRREVVFTYQDADTIAISNSNPTNCGPSNVTYTSTLVASSAAAYTYTWAASPFLDTTTGSTVEASINNTSNFTVTGTDGFCYASASSAVSRYRFPVVVPTAEFDSVCPGATSVLYSNTSAAGFTIQGKGYSPESETGETVTFLCQNGVANVQTDTGIDDLDDGGWFNVPLGFDFDFLGTNYTTVNVSTNGNIQFGSTALFNSAFSAVTIPSASTPNNFIALFWGDLDFGSAEASSIRYWTGGIAPNRVFNIKFDGIRFNQATSRYSGQIALNEATGQIELDIQEVTHSGVVNTVMGAENIDGTIGGSPTGRALGTWQITSPEGWVLNPPADYSFNWLPSAEIDGATNLDTAVASPSAPTTYQLVVTDNATTCDNSVNNQTFVTVGVASAAPVASFTISDNTPTTGGVLQTVTLTATTPELGGETYLWNITPATFTYVGGTNALSRIPQVQFNAPGFYSVTFQVTSCTGNNSVVLNNAINATAVYCFPSFANACSGGDEVGDVEIFNPAGQAIMSHLGTGCTLDPDGYEVFAPISGLTSCTFYQGSTYTIEVSSGYPFDYFGAWIDVNNDGDFDDALEFLGSSLTAGAFASFELGIPSSNVIYGAHKMRIICADIGTPLVQADACINDSWGEAHDYTVFIQPPVILNDIPQFAVSVQNSSNLTYPTCYAFTGNTALATNSPETAGSVISGGDTWYRFTAQSTAVSIKVTSSTMDDIIALYSRDGAGNYVLVASENAATGASDFEQLNVDGLTAGTQYWIAVGYNTPGTGGAFSICIQNLMRSGCNTVVPVAGLRLCDAYRATYRGAPSQGVTYTFNFTPTGVTPGSATSVSGTNGLITLSNAALALRYGGVYDVDVDVTYSLTNSIGTAEVINVAGISTDPRCTGVSIQAHPNLEVRSNQRCPATLLRTNFLVGTTVAGSTSSFVCGAINYSYEFVQVTSCADATALGLADTITTVAASPYLGLGALGNLPNAGAWDVRIRPNFSYGPGAFGPVHRILVNNTAAGSELEEGSVDGSEKVSTFVAANLYPNPNNGEMVNLNVAGIESDNVFVRITDAMGRIVYTNRFTVEGSLNTIVTFAEPLASGIYNVEFSVDGQIMTERMIVAKQ